MKKLFLSLLLVCAFSLSSCGNAEIDKIEKLVNTATEQTIAATSLEEVASIATTLQVEMDKIEAEAGGKLTLGKSVDESLAKYQAAAAAKLKEFNVELEVE